MKIKEIKLYEFKELSKESKEIAINKWYEHEDYPFMCEDLTESLKCLLEMNKINEVNNLKLHYSLSYCQGEGVCFTGDFKWKNYNISITHNFHYCHKRSTDINITTQSDNEASDKVYSNFKELYYSICDDIEKEGYEILEYRMSEEEFEDHCLSMDYTFLSNGIMENI